MNQTADADRGALAQLVCGYMAALPVAGAVRLGVPDAVGDTERPADEVAGELGTDPTATGRLLRALAALGLADESRPGVFALTGRGALLRSDRGDSMAPFVSMFLDPAMVEAWGHLDESVRTGRTSFDTVFGTDFFGHLAAHPALSRTFNASMRQGTLATARVLPSTVDLAGAEVVADVGGGDGTLLAAMLAAHPGVRGILVDTAEGSAQSAPVLEAARVADRCDVVVADFFREVPVEADVVLIKSVVHDWDDERCRVILGHVRAALRVGGRLLVIEPVMPETVDGKLPPIMYLSDLNMLVNVGGRERTEPEFRALLASAGFSVTAVRPLPPPMAFSVIEAVVA